MIKRLSIIFLLIPVLFLFKETRAKAVLLNEDSGLNNIEVNAVTKDKDGRMWIATRRGLNKYDGYRFADIPFFKNVKVNTILYDSTRDVIWVGTEMGLYYTDCKTGEVTRCTTPGKENPITCLVSFRGDVIVGFRYKYVLLINAEYSCKVICSFVGELHPGKLSVNSAGDVYFYTGKFIEITRRNGWARREIKPLKRYVGFIEVVHDKVYSGGVNGGVWNVNGVDTSDWFLDSLQGLKRDPECMIDVGNLIYIAYRNETRIFEVNTSERSITNISAGDEAVFITKRINCLFKDESGIIWVGTSKGLIKLIPDKPTPNFERLLWNHLPTTVSTRQILGEANGDLYVGTYAGFFHYRKHSDTWTNTDKIYYLGAERPFSQRSLLNMDQQFLYVGSDANYFARYDKKKGIFEKLNFSSADGKCNTDGSTMALERDKNGLIWMGSERGLLSFDPVKKELKCHLNDKYSVDGATVRYIFMLPGRSQFWAGTENGIYLIDIQKGMLKHVDMKSVPALGGNLINAITSDVKGNIWIATDDAGVNVLSADHQSIYSITKEDGLSSNEIYSILWQDSVRVWISTYKGLNYYHTQTETIIQYFESDGITNNEFNQNSAFRADDGKLYFGSINGITSFYPTQIDTREQPFQIFVSGMTKWEKSSARIVDVKADEQQRIRLEPGDNLLSFSFGVSDYINSELHNYFYKIEGHNDEWIPLGTQPLLRLESLKGGEYKLLVKAVKGSRGASSVNTLAYQISIEQEFYRTIWFYILLAAGLAVLVFYYFSNRLRTQKEMEILRVKIASNLHDEVGSLLTRITMSADRLVTRMPRDSETRDKLEGVSALSREANVAMSDVLWTIDARNDFTGSLTDRMREHAEDLLLPRGIDVTIDFSDIDQTQKLSPEFRQHLFLLYKEIINNIIKHSRADRVLILYKQSKNQLLLQVKNNGVVERTGTVSTGQGLRNIKMRAEHINGKVEIIRTAEEFEVQVRI